MRNVHPRREVRRWFGQRKRNRRVQPRAHVGSLRRVLGWVRRALPWVACATIVAVAGLGGLGLWQQIVNSPRLRVRQVSVQGNARASSADVLAHAGAAVDAPILTLNLDAMAAQVQRHPWVRSASVRRRLPDQLVIDVVEHVPTLLVSLGDVYVADEDGQLFKGFSAADSLVLPVLTGLDREDARARPERVTEHVRIAMALGAAVENRVVQLGELQELHWDDDLGWSIVTRGGGATASQVRIHLGRQPLQRLSAAIRTLHVLAESRRIPAVIWADGIKNPDRVSVQLLGGVDAVRAGDRRGPHGTES